ncbi:MAG: hypothetical protein EXS05_22770 [Planctomycetaceae bacterium]|nr:hypothetical protein [Planctomycetaceae bacterium]
MPFFVMPLLKGESLESRLRREGRLSVADTVSIGKQIAIGIAAAHDRGLVHRDIKPANIWLEQRGQQFPRVRILDFGLARNEDDESLLTKTGSIAGTPAFMAPEQARGDLADARSDLFSLGCVLYCLLAGKPPFTGRNSAAMMFAIINHRPESLGDIQPDMPEGLASLVMQLLEKDPARRVKRANDVALALQIMEDESSRQNPVDAGDSNPQADKPIGQPILAEKVSAALDSNRTASIRVEGARLISRNRIGAAAAVMLMAIGVYCAVAWIVKVETPHGTVILELDSQEASGAEVYVDEQRRITLRLQPGGEPITLEVDSGAHKLKVAKAGFEIFTREFSMAAGGREQFNVRLEPKNISREANVASGNAHATTEQAATHPRSALRSGMTGDAPFPGLVPHPARMAGLRRWQIETLAPRGDIFAVAWDHDGRRVACGSPIGNVRIIDVATSKTLCIIPAHTGSVWAMDWSPAEDRIVTAGEDGAVRLFDSKGEFQRELGSHSGTARSVAFSRDGSWIASGGADSKIRLWRTTGELGPILTGHGSQIDGVAWHPSGKKLASASLDGTVRIWDLNGAWNTNGIRGQELKGHLGGVLGLSWSFDGELLASAGMDGAVLLWTSNGTRHSTLSGHGNAVTAITWSGNGLIATSGDDKTVRLWQRDGALLKTQKMEVGRINDLEWSRDGSRLAIATDRQGIRFLNKSGEWDGEISLDTISIRALSFNKAGELAAAGDEGFVGVWNADGTRKTQLEGHRKTVFSVSWNPSGSQLVSGSWDMPVRVWDAEGAAIATRNGTHPTAWNPTTEEVAWTSGPDVHVAEAGAPARVLRGHQSQVIRLIWNSSGTQLASADTNGAIRVWNRDGSSAGAIQSDPIVLALAWHPKKPLLASGSAGNGNIQLWGLDGNLIKTWNAHTKGITALDYSPDGERLISSAYDQHVRVWNEEGNAVGTFPGPMAIVCATAWNATGQQTATAHIDGTVCLWDGSTFEPKATSVVFNDGNWARFDSKGISNSSDSTAVDRRVVVVAEDELGAISLMKVSEFRERKAPPGN